MKKNWITYISSVVWGLGLVAPANAGNELGVRVGGFDGFYAGVEWQTTAWLGPAVIVPSIDFGMGDLDGVAVNGDLRWNLLPVPDTGIIVFGKAGPTLFLADQNSSLGLSLTIAADIAMRKGRSLQLEWRFGLGDIPDQKLGLALMFPI